MLYQLFKYWIHFGFLQFREHVDILLHFLYFPPVAALGKSGVWQLVNPNHQRWMWHMLWYLRNPLPFHTASHHKRPISSVLLMFFVLASYTKEWRCSWLISCEFCLDVLTWNSVTGGRNPKQSGRSLWQTWEVQGSRTPLQAGTGDSREGPWKGPSGCSQTT